MNVKISQNWKNILQLDFEMPYFEKIVSFLKEEKRIGKIIYPPGSKIFNAFNLTQINDIKVVIIGQDPYHGQGQAHGLCFSVSDGIAIPPSLQNIYKEINTDIGCPIPKHGNLTTWAAQGVFLLNASLTVEQARPMSHQKIGWDIFTNQVIKKISEHKSHVVFILWGKFAQEKEMLIDAGKHKILKSAHPSPLSAYNGFFGCKHFSKTNQYLIEHNIEPINWQLL